MSEIKFASLGGVREFGKNLYIIEIGQSIFVLDTGLKYPETEMLGVDYVIPDMEYLFENTDRIAGIFLSHGHSDSIGALPYLLAEVNAPVFGSELTIELAKINTKAYEPTKKFDDFHVVDEKTEIDFGEALVSFFYTTHTIPESMGVVLSSKDGNIVYTGDFKFDPAVEAGYKTSMSRLAEIGKNGVLALLSNSSNALTNEQSAKESEIYDKIFDTMDDWEGRIIVACNSGNIGRIQQVVDAAFDLERRIAFTGPDIDKIIETARRLGKLRIEQPKALVDPKEISKYPASELVIIETGRMGEPLEALNRMAQGRNRFVSIQEGDLVFSVTSPSLAFETKVARVEDAIYKAGGIMKMLSSEIKISGSANARELQFMLDLMAPKNLIPVQGEYREMKAHADLAMELGMMPDHIFLGKRGEVIKFDGEKMAPEGTITAENIMIDGAGIGDIGSIVLRDRKVLSEDGIFITAITISKADRKIVSHARVHTRGFVYIKTSKNLVKEASDLADATVEKYLAEPGFDWSELKGAVRDALGKFLYDQTKRKPAVLPIVMEARQPQFVNQFSKKTKNGAGTQKPDTQKKSGNPRPKVSDKTK